MGKRFKPEPQSASTANRGQSSRESPPETLDVGRAADQNEARTGKNGGLDPRVKEWLDRVIVPALVRAYIARQKSGSLAKQEHDVPAFAAHGEVDPEQK